MSEESHQCTVSGCNKAYSHLRGLKQHLKTAHVQDDAVKPGRFSCKDCGQIFYHATKLALHRENEHGESREHTPKFCI